MMILFSSMSSLSNHVSQLGCLYETEGNVVVRKQARFLCTTTQVVMTMPIIFAAFMWLYWLVLVPLLLSVPILWNGQKALHSEARPGCLKRTNEKRINRRGIQVGLLPMESNMSLTALLKTRDIWVLCMTLFFILYPTLVKYPMAMLSCVKLHTSDEVIENFGSKKWVKLSYLRSDLGGCWQGGHWQTSGASPCQAYCMELVFQ